MTFDEAESRERSSAAAQQSKAPGARPIRPARQRTGNPISPPAAHSGQEVSPPRPSDAAATSTPPVVGLAPRLTDASQGSPLDPRRPRCGRGSLCGWWWLGRRRTCRAPDTEASRCGSCPARLPAGRTACTASTRPARVSEDPQLWRFEHLDADAIPPGRRCRSSYRPGQCRRGAVGHESSANDRQLRFCREPHVRCWRDRRAGGGMPLDRGATSVPFRFPTPSASPARCHAPAPGEWTSIRDYVRTGARGARVDSSPTA